MRELVMVGFIIGIMACGKAATEPAEVAQLPVSVEAPQGCSVQQTAAGAIIACPDGTSAIILHGTVCNPKPTKGGKHE